MNHRARRQPLASVAGLACLAGVFAAAGLQGCVQRPPAAPAATAPGAAAAIAALRCNAQTQWRLYFGFDTPSGALRADEWQAFVARELAPRLPAGYTLVAAAGQWQGSDGRVQQEESRVLEVVAEDRLALRQALAEIAGTYKARFRQQAVLITETETRVCR